MTPAVTPPAPPKKPAKERRWAPRMWLGCDLLGWLKLLVRNRFKVGWQYWYIAVIDTIGSVINTLLRYLQAVIYGVRIRRTEIDPQPLFILGHWRSGTTLLHELLILDERHSFPTTYQCFAPNHFLLTEGFVTRWMRFLMPSRRPMDNMAVGWERPQEDEFALCNLGVPSPYFNIAFPNEPPHYPEFLDLEGLTPQQLAHWKRKFVGFLTQVSYKHPGKRIVLKSPPHTCRLKVLLELFPDAKFVNLVRDPAAVYPSTVKLWKSMYETQGLQRPTFAGIEEYVLETFSRMHDTLERTRALVPAGNFHELRYEDLVRDPKGRMQELYARLSLGNFEQLLPAFENYLASVADYKTNRHELSDADWRLLGARWRPFFERYGYQLKEPASATV